MNKKNSWLNILSLCFILLWVILASVPFLWTLWGSFKVESDFFSKQDWRNAIFGVRTIIETGGIFTTNGYEGAWIKEEFWRDGIIISLTPGLLVSIVSVLLQNSSPTFFSPVS